MNIFHNYFKWLSFAWQFTLFSSEVWQLWAQIFHKVAMCWMCGDMFSYYFVINSLLRLSAKEVCGHFSEQTLFEIISDEIVCRLKTVAKHNIRQILSIQQKLLKFTNNNQEPLMQVNVTKDHVTVLRLYKSHFLQYRSILTVWQFTLHIIL